MIVHERSWRSSKSSGGFDQRDCAQVDIALRMPDIVRRLHAQPNLAAIAKEFAKPHGNGRRHGLLLGQDVMEMLTRDAKVPGNFRFRPLDRWDDVFPQEFAWMGGAAVWIALGGIFLHFRFLSMILNKIKTERIAAAEFEGDAPGAIDMHGVSRWFKTLERLEIETRHPHLFGNCRRIELIQPPSNSTVQSLVDFRRIAS
jgi:hypothetical protein